MNIKQMVLLQFYNIINNLLIVITFITVYSHTTPPSVHVREVVLRSRGEIPVQVLQQVLKQFSYKEVKIYKRFFVIHLSTYIYFKHFIISFLEEYVT